MAWSGSVWSMTWPSRRGGTGSSFFFYAPPVAQKRFDLHVTWGVAAPLQGYPVVPVCAVGGVGGAVPPLVSAPVLVHTCHHDMMAGVGGVRSIARNQHTRPCVPQATASVARRPAPSPPSSPPPPPPLTLTLPLPPPPPLPGRGGMWGVGRHMPVAGGGGSVSGGGGDDGGRVWDAPSRRLGPAARQTDRPTMGVGARFAMAASDRHATPPGRGAAGLASQTAERTAGHLGVPLDTGAYAVWCTLLVSGGRRAVGHNHPTRFCSTAGPSSCSRPPDWEAPRPQRTSEAAKFLSPACRMALQPMGRWRPALSLPPPPHYHPATAAVHSWGGVLEATERLCSSPHPLPLPSSCAGCPRGGELPATPHTPPNPHRSGDPIPPSPMRGVPRAGAVPR